MKEYKVDSLYGLGTALVTPFKADGQVDYEALARLLDTQLTGFVDYIVVLGTTGEAATLTEKEREQVRRFIVDYVKKPSAISHQPSAIPLVLGVGGNNTAAVCESLRTMDLSGFAAILSVCPYYNKPNQEGLYQHFCKVAEASPIPIILYNVPGRTGVNLLPETVMRIWEAHPDEILGIKEASGNLEQIKRLIALSQESRVKSQEPLLVISGDDGIACEVMEAGGAGLISVASNAFPEDFYDIVHNKDQAKQDKYKEMIRLLFAEGNPVGIKAVLAQKGIIQNYLRLPLVPASKELNKEIEKELA
ncbi:MAG: 4-hydroxy-tetrahydrodipicolinate synthase [Paludibacteraceae bacterium]|nr:4-hydroxy-tetrahydrodipicolinate synthase [Paludibacteraceae bacterium]